MAIPVPTLSTSGWVYATPERADTLLAYFFEADEAQSSIYAGNVSSLQALLQQNTQNIAGLVRGINTTLSYYLGRYFQNVVVDVTSDDTAANLTGEITIRIFCNITEDGRQVSLGKLLYLNGEKFDKVLRIINA